MDQDAFTGGVEPGGLWNRNDIRILLCYILNSAGAPLSLEDLERILQEKALANYFEVSDALSALEEQGHIEQSDGLYSVTETGREIAGSLDNTLPLSVRDKALEAALSLLASARRERENRVEILETKNGVKVSCHVCDGELELMSFSLYVPDKAQAQIVKRNFHKDPAALYQLLLAVLTEDRGFLKDYLHGKGI